MKWLKRILVLVIALVLLIFITAYLYLHSFKPSYSGALKLKGLQQETQVYFDEFGVPHIFGSSEEDVFRTLGHIQAQERWFQIELIRRVSSGRLSEIFGSSVLDVDRYFRMLGIRQHAQQAAEEFAKHPDEPWNKAATAYLEGLNDYIRNGKAPLEFSLLGIQKEEYTVRDLYLIVSYVSFNFQMAFRTDPLLDRIKNQWGIKYLKELGLNTNEEGKAQTALQEKTLTTESLLLADLESIQNKLPLQLWTGSNSMLISARKSSTGKSLFENDTHIGHQQPSVWFESYLECPGFRFYGSSIAGFPFAPLGHSERHAWGMTIFENDDLDFYREKINPENRNQVWEKDHWADLKIREEVIHVKDSSDVKILCRSSYHGPVCSDVMKDFKTYGEAPIAACWTFLREPNKMVEITYALAHSKSMSEFKKALSELSAPGLNVLYADAENNIAWWAAGKISKRAEGLNPNFVLDGSDSTQDWLGYYDFSQNPFLENPPEGYIFSCNQAPGPVNGLVYPGYYLPDDRASRVKTLLDSKDIFTLKDLQSFSMDVQNPVAAMACHLLLGHLDQNKFKSGSADAKMIRVLASWNGEHKLTDPAPAFYYRWFYHLYKSTFDDELGAQDASAFLKTHLQKSSLLPLFNNDSSAWWDNVNTKDKIESMNEIVSISFDSAFNDMLQEFGNDPLQWTWDKVHTLELEHPLGKQWPLNYLFNVGSFPIEGGMETVNNQSFLYTPELSFKSNLGPAVRRSIDFADPENGQSVIPGGQSGNPMSPHYSDQTSLYVSGKLRKEMMNSSEIKSSCRDSLIFSPE